jgi:cytochrome c oxidase subunit 1
MLPENISLEGQKQLYAWLSLAVASLVGAGVFATLVALGRTPGFQDLLPGGDYFRRALVGHVNLAVVIWFLTFQGVLWSLATGGEDSLLVRLGFRTTALGAATLTLPALLGWGNPILSNYIPVLTHPLFILGQLFLMTGMGLTAAYTLFKVLKLPRPLSLISFGGGITSTLVLISLVCFGLSGAQLSQDLSSQVYFEKLAWGGGHILQFSNTAAMVVVWILLLSQIRETKDIPDLLKGEKIKRLLKVFLILALPAPLFYFSEDSKTLFTLLMAMGLGPVSGIAGILILWTLFLKKPVGSSLPLVDPGFSGLALSILLFGLGGAIAGGINGSNVIIPAHYHAVIGGVTVAFMGLTYRLLPLISRKVWSHRLSSVQPYLYASGQILFVLGLFWAGSHGVPRKTFGANQTLHSFSQVMGMAIMGLGGVIAISGGIAFIINLVPSLFRPINPELEAVLSSRPAEWLPKED